MSSSPTAPTSTTASSTSSHFPVEPAEEELSERRTALVACGAIAQPCAEIGERRGWAMDVFPLPPLLHNQPQHIAGRVEELVVGLRADYSDVAVGYADCGTYGALDEVCARLGVRRLGGLHCYDLYAGADRMRRLFDEEAGTYVLTDFLVRSFRRTVLAELGLDRHPELRDDYFGHYTRVVWLTQHPEPELRQQAEEAAERLGLPLVVVDTGVERLERALAELVGESVT